MSAVAWVRRPDDPRNRRRIDVARDHESVGRPRIEIELFAEIEVDGSTRRYGGGFTFAELGAEGDPTSELIEAAFIEREANVGNFLRDMKNAGLDVTRFELYSAPFRIEWPTTFARA